MMTKRTIEWHPWVDWTRSGEKVNKTAEDAKVKAGVCQHCKKRIRTPDDEDVREALIAVRTVHGKTKPIEIAGRAVYRYSASGRVVTAKCWGCK